MNRDILVEVALRADYKTVEAICCVSIKLHDVCDDDFWKQKFFRQYPNATYHSFWSARENYQLQHRGNKMEIFISLSPVRRVDCILYEYTSLKHRIVEMNKNVARHQIHTRFYKFVRMKLSKHGQYALIFVDYEESYELRHIESFPTLIEAQSFADQHGEYYEFQDFEYAIINLACLTPEFSIKEEMPEGDIRCWTSIYSDDWGLYWEFG